MENKEQYYQNQTCIKRNSTSQICNTQKNYNDEPTINEYLLKEMAKAYTSAFEKAGIHFPLEEYSQNKKEEKNIPDKINETKLKITNDRTNNNSDYQTTLPQNRLNQQQPQINPNANLTPISNNQKSSNTNENEINYQQPRTNLSNVNGIERYLQLIEEQLTQISTQLTEISADIKTQNCILERQRRIRLS